MYEERFYRQHITSNFGIEVTYQESDLYISTDKKISVSSAREIVKKYYNQISSYIKENPLFQSSLSPAKPNEKDPDIIREMAKCSQITGIGPFSSVAGAIAQFVGKELLEFANEVVVVHKKAEIRFENPYAFLIVPNLVVNDNGIGGDPASYALII